MPFVNPSLGELVASMARHEETADPLPQPLSLAQLQSSISHEGNLERLRCFLQKLRQGGNLTIAE